MKLYTKWYNIEKKYLRFDVVSSGSSSGSFSGLSSDTTLIVTCVVPKLSMNEKWYFCYESNILLEILFSPPFLYLRLGVIGSGSGTVSGSSSDAVSIVVPKLFANEKWYFC